jgi:hypothetical protein
LDKGINKDPDAMPGLLPRSFVILVCVAVVKRLGEVAIFNNLAPVVHGMPAFVKVERKVVGA